MTVCILCDRTVVDLHHLTGRSNGEYVDPDLVVPLCHRHHELAGTDLRAEGLERANAHTNVVELMTFRLACIGVFFARAANGDPSSMFARLASSFRRWSDELRTAAASEAGHD